MGDIIPLSGRLDLAAAGPLHAQLMPLTSKPIVLDLAEVTHVGALCLQTLIATARACAGDGGSLSLKNPGDAVVAQLASMGSSPEQIMKGQL